MGRALSVLVWLVVFICTVQALYWPVIPKPPSIQWWQVRELAEIGRYIGWPVGVIGLLTQSQIAAWLANLVWSSALALLTYKLAKKL